jgi:hypothetical protein
MPGVDYYFMDSDNRLINMDVPFDFIDPEGQTVDYKVVVYTPGTSFTLLHNVPADIDRALDKIATLGDWEVKDKGTMDALDIMTNYPESGIETSDRKEGRNLNFQDNGTLLYVERTTPYNYPILDL